MQLLRGQAQQALDTWQRAAATYAHFGDRIGAIGSLINQAQAMQALGLYRRALVTLDQVNQTLQKQPDSSLKASGLRSLGNALRMVGDLERSRQVLQQSLTVAQQLKSPPDIAAALFSLGNTARTQQDIKAALNYYQQAANASDSDITRTQAELNQLSLLVETAPSTALSNVASSQEGKERTSSSALETTIYKEVSAVSARHGKRPLSFAAVLKQTLLPQIQSQIVNLPASRASVYARINFAQSLMKLERREVGEQSSHTIDPSAVAQLLATAVKQANSLGDARSQSYALGNLAGLYEQTHQLGSAKDLTEQALLIAQAINAPDISYRWQWQLGRILKTQGDTKGAIAAYQGAVQDLQSLRRDLVAVNPDVQFSFRDEVEPVYRQLVDLLLQSKGDSQPSQQNLVQARSIIESLQLAELDNFFRAACLEGKPVQIDQVVDRDDRTAAVIYPIILPDRLEVILKLPGQQLRHYKTAVLAGEVEKLLADFQQNLTRPHTLSEVRQQAKQVYDWLIRPADASLAKSQIKTLVFVLDGSLRNIPMAALYDGKQYLVQKYAVALTPGLQLLPPKPLAQERLTALTAGLSEARQGFAALTNVALELKQIKSEVPSTTVLFNQQFTTKNLEQKISDHPLSVVHLATHGQFSSQADKTFILTWDSRININQLQNLLQNRETGDTSIRSALELLVLSACETASGDKRAALGLAGVAVRAGARSTLASLWSLDDQSAAVLMGHFYGELDHPQINKAQALRLGQMGLLKNPQWQHPYYWAAYVLVGNWL